MESLSIKENNLETVMLAAISYVMLYGFSLGGQRGTLLTAVWRHLCSDFTKSAHLACLASKFSGQGT